VKKTYAYFIRFMMLMSFMPSTAQETLPPPDSMVVVPLSIRTGLEISGPVIYFADKTILNLEGSISADINDKIAVLIGGGYSNYGYSQYNYEFKTKGTFFKAGADFNLLRPEIAVGKYWAGLGIHYGLSRFTYETPSFKHDNYWGSVSFSMPAQTNWGHYLEIAGGFRAELFKNFSIGWLISLRKMIYTGASREIRPIYYPGYGQGGESLSYSINYFISYNIRYRQISVRIKPEPVEEPEENEDEELPEDSSNLGRQRIGR
jgi:hypothetical protein